MVKVPMFTIKDDFEPLPPLRCIGPALKISIHCDIRSFSSATSSAIDGFLEIAEKYHEAEHVSARLSLQFSLLNKAYISRRRREHWHRCVRVSMKNVLRRSSKQR